MRLEYFEMIDRVVRLDRANKRLEARATVPTQSPVFEGHFPGYPLMPGVLLTETMAQASGFLVLALTEFSEMPFLMAVDKARFRSFVGPGVELAVEATLEHQGSGYVATKAKITANQKPLCDADLRFRTMPFPQGIEEALRERSEAIGLMREQA